MDSRPARHASRRADGARRSTSATAATSPAAAAQRAPPSPPRACRHSRTPTPRRSGRRAAAARCPGPARNGCARRPRFPHRPGARRSRRSTTPPATASTSRAAGDARSTSDRSRPRAPRPAGSTDPGRPRCRRCALMYCWAVSRHDLPSPLCASVPSVAGIHCKLRRMRVLLLSMPDSFEHMAPVAIRMPNGALASLAGNVDPHHRSPSPTWSSCRAVSAPTVERLIRELQPDVVGLSVMTFQRATALAIAALVRRLAPRRTSSPAATIRASRREPTSAADAIDFVVRGEGEHTFRALLRALEQGGDLADIAGLSHRRERRAGPQRRIAPVARLATEPLALPNRAARVLDGLHAARAARRRRRDVARLHVRLQLLLDHRDARPQLPPLSDRSRARRHRRRAAQHGARAIFLVDDNITLDVAALRAALRGDHRRAGCTTPITSSRR